MVNVIKHFNSPKEATTLGGHRVQREDRIFLASYQQWFPVLQADLHFCFKDPQARQRGSTILCTCGAPAGIFGFEAYKRFSDKYLGNEVICCTNLIQYRVHSDGSHE